MLAVAALGWEQVALKGSPPSARSGATCCLVAGAASAPELLLFGGFGDGVERDEIFLLKPGLVALLINFFRLGDRDFTGAHLVVRLGRRYGRRACRFVLAGDRTRRSRRRLFAAQQLCLHFWRLEWQEIFKLWLSL